MDQIVKTDICYIAICYLAECNQKEFRMNGLGGGWLKCGTLGMRQMSRWEIPTPTLKPTHAAPPASLAPPMVRFKPLVCLPHGVRTNLCYICTTKPHVWCTFAFSFRHFCTKSSISVKHCKDMGKVLETKYWHCQEGEGVLTMQDLFVDSILCTDSVRTTGANIE